MIDGQAERDAAFERLREAYMDLESAKPMRELGRAAAFVNHEIKNYMMVISGYAALLLRSKKLDERDRAVADNIAAAVAKLHDFSKSVLETSRREAAGGEEEFDLARRLGQCADAGFAERAPDISINCAQNTLLINGSPEKWERLLTEALRNSFEAGAKNVSVRLSAINFTALIVIEDDGAGCEAGQLPNLSTPFFTTKRGGAGLGLCAVRSIVEAYNGCISVYPKNVLGGGKHGLSIQILVPASKNTPCEAAKTEIALVKDGLPCAPKIMNMLTNLKIVPRTAGKVSEISGERQNSLSELIIIAAAPKAEELNGFIGGNEKIKLLPIEEADGGILMVSNKELLTEEYIVNCLRG